MIKKNNIQLPLLLLITFVLSSCTSVPRNELRNLPSLIEIKSINFTNGLLQLRISHRNSLTRENNQLSCQLTLKNFPPIKFNRISLPDLTNYAIETIDINLTPDKLPSIDQAQKSISYVLDCYMFSENFQEEHIIKKSILFQVPGIKAEFR